MAGQKGVTWYTQHDEWTKYAAKKTLSSKVVIRIEGEKKAFPGKQKLKRFITIIPDIQEILKGNHWEGEKDQKQQRLQRNREYHQEDQHYS